MASMLKIPIERLAHGEGLSLPNYQTRGAAGMDICAALEIDLELAPFKRALIPTGFAIALPEGYEAQIRPRSGLAVRYGITVLNAPGTIDCDYRGEIKVPLINLGEERFTIKRGERIAQMIIAPYRQVGFDEVAVLETTQRGEGGFGSTGIGGTGIGGLGT